MKLNRPKRIADVSVGQLLRVKGMYGRVSFILATRPGTHRVQLPNDELVTVVKSGYGLHGANVWTCTCSKGLIQISRHDFGDLELVD